MARNVHGWTPWREDGPWHALAAEGQSWCGLPPPAPREPLEEPEGRPCKNCRRALEGAAYGGSPWQIDSGFRLYKLYVPSPRSPYVTRRPPGEGWREQRESWWRCITRARSWRQAKWLTAKRIRAKGGGPGIVKVRAPVVRKDLD